MPVKIVYIGPLRSPLDERGDIEIETAGRSGTNEPFGGNGPGIWVRAGVPVEVETDLAEQLLEQEGNWARANTKAAKEAADESGGK